MNRVLFCHAEMGTEFYARISRQICKMPERENDFCLIGVTDGNKKTLQMIDRLQADKADGMILVAGDVSTRLKEAILGLRRWRQPASWKCTCVRSHEAGCFLQQERKKESGKKD